MKIKDLIKQKRESLGENQSEFGERFGVTKTAISLYESGKREAPYKVIEFIINSTSEKIECQVCGGKGWYL